MDKSISFIDTISNPAKEAGKYALSEQEIQFCYSFIRSFNPEKASKDAGFEGVNHVINGATLMLDPLVQTKIAMLVDEHVVTNGISVDVINRGLLAEALNHSPNSSHSARVSAWNTIARIAGVVAKPGDTDDGHDDDVELLEMEDS